MNLVNLVNHVNHVKLLPLALVFLAIISISCTENVAPTNTSRTAATPSPAASVDQFATARANFAKNCEACHGEDATGGLVKVDNKRIKVPSLKAEHAIKHTDDEILKMITIGEEEMPAFKDKMSQQEIAEMVRFVRKEIQGR